MFCDISNFTGIAEKLSPETLVSALDKHFRKFDHIILKYDLEKIKTIGDAYMCVAGLDGRGDAASNTANMMAAAYEMNTLNAAGAADGPEFRFRIGIHTGSVTSGVVGFKKYAFDIWGDAVNVAARMEQHSEAGRINVSGDTFELLRKQFTFVHRGKITVKNKGEVDMYFAENS
jgi:class 3 adenylate cyclase